MTTKELAECYYQVAQDLERKHRALSEAIAICFRFGDGYSEQAMHEHANAKSAKKAKADRATEERK